MTNMDQFDSQRGKNQFSVKSFQGGGREQMSKYLYVQALLHNDRTQQIL